jgi:hypothetical protein
VINTHTTWDDTGYDCDHCGGRILKRTDHESGLPDQSCFQCEQCSCQWTLANQPLRVGTLRACRKAQRTRAAITEAADPYARWILVGLGVLAFLFLLRFGGGVALRFLLPVLLAAGALYLFARFGRTQDWW